MNARPTFRIKNFLQLLVGANLLFSMPASGTYQLKAYDFNAGGGEGGSTNYQLYGMLGGFDLSEQILGTTRGINPGLGNTMAASMPPAPTFVNDGGFTNKLRIIIDPSDNQTGGTNPVLFAVAISDDDWATTKYVQSDFTVGSILGIEDYMTYAAWGGATGDYIVSLTPNTSYKTKVTALHGEFTESGFGESSAAAATSAVDLTFDVDVSPTDTDTDPPFVVDLGTLQQNTVVTASNKVWFDLSTHAPNGATIYVRGVYAGLFSQAANATIVSAAANLASGGVTSGFGFRSASATQASGGPLTAQSHYDGSGDNVGAVTTNLTPMYLAASAIDAGRASFLVKAKISDTTPAAKDYTETAILIATPNF